MSNYAKYFQAGTVNNSRIAQWDADGNQITIADIEAALQKLKDSPIRICGVTEPHIVHPKALEVPGFYTCANCFSPLLVETGGKLANE